MPWISQSIDSAVLQYITLSYHLHMWCHWQWCSIVCFKIYSRWPSLANWVGFTLPQLAQIDLSCVDVPLNTKQTKPIFILIYDTNLCLCRQRDDRTLLTLLVILICYWHINSTILCEPLSLCVITISFMWIFVLQNVITWVEFVHNLLICGFMPGN